MSNSGKAVFLSYASQDAEAAKRICDALRAAGVEVWFDQSELVGGDAWDAKIRKQIGSCALFIPLVSANTQARAEGYFRLEWRLADKRTELMGKSKAFLLPVCIDDTKDADADVPDSFLAVQWTRLSGGETTPAFVARVQKLLRGEPKQEDMQSGTAGRRSAAEAAVEHPAAKPGRKVAWIWAGIAVAGVTVAYFGLRTKNAANPVAGPVAQAQEPAAQVRKAAPGPVLDPKVAEARALCAKAEVLFDNLDAVTHADFELAGEMLKRALDLAPLDAEVWGYYSWYCSNLYSMGGDKSLERETEIKRAADKAIKLDPKSDMARFGWANYYRRQSATVDESIRILRDLVQKWPDKAIFLRALALSLKGKGKPEEALAILDRAIALPGSDAHAWIQKGSIYSAMGKSAEADATVEQSLAVKPTPRVLIRKADILIARQGDLEGAEKVMAQIPGDFLQEDRAVAVAAKLALWQRRPDQALQVLGAFPRDYLEDGDNPVLAGPKALLAGYARWLEGKPEVARLEWAEALRVVDSRLESRRTDVTLNSRRMELLALLGRRSEAETAAKLLAQLKPGTAGWDQALIDTWNGELGRAIEFMATRSLTLSLRYAPQWEPLRKDPRFQALLAKLASAPNAATTSDTPPAPAEKSVAVLAFDDLSEKHDSEYFSNGISEELLNVLAKVPGLKVTARTSSFHFKGKDTPMPEIARQLGVAYVVEGSVRKQGDKVRITAQLIKAADGFHVWSDTFTRDLKDIFAVQDEIAGLIAQNLQLKLGVLGQAGQTANPEAHQLYLQGKYFQGRGTLEDTARATALLQRAVELDPSFAQAWAALSSAGWYRGGYGNSRQDFDEGYALARRAADQAIALEPALVAGHIARFDLQSSIDFDWKGSKESLRRVQALAPNDPSVVFRTAALAYTFGEEERAIELIRQAVALDPVNPAVYTTQGYILLAARRFADAEAAFRHIIDISPTSPWGHAGVGLALVARGQAAQAVAAAEQESTEWSRLYVLALARWSQKDRAAADAVLAEFIRRNADVAAYQIATVYAYRSEPGKAFEWLERAYRQRDPGLSWAKPDFFLQALHADPRWDPFLRKLGLTDDQLK